MSADGEPTLILICVHADTHESSLGSSVRNLVPDSLDSVPDLGFSCRVSSWQGVLVPIWYLSTFNDSSWATLLLVLRH